MADGLVDKEEVERLAERADNRHTLLLADRQASGERIGLGADLEGVEHTAYFVATLEAGQPVLYVDILHNRQLREKMHLLRQIGKRPLAQSTPAGYRERPDVGAVEEDSAAVVGARAVDEAAEARLAGTALGLDKPELRFFKSQLAQPDLRMADRRIDKPSKFNAHS